MNCWQLKTGNRQLNTRYASRFTRYELCSLLKQRLPGTPSRPKTSAISAFSAVKNSCLCVFCASLRLTRSVFSRLLKTVVCLLSTGNRQLATFLSPSIRDTQYAIRSTKVYVRKNNLFMQNKANFQKVKLNVNKVLTKDYDQMDTWSIRKTKPIQSQFKANQTQLKPIKCQNKPNSNSKTRPWRANSNSQTRRGGPNKPNTQYAIRNTCYELRTMIYELRTITNKPNFKHLSAICVAGRRQKMLLRMTINTRHVSFCPYADGRLFAGQIPNRRQEFLAANYKLKLDFSLNYV